MFQVTGIKISGRVGTHIIFSGKKIYIILCILKGTCPFKMHKFTYVKQVAQWATIAHHGASIIFGDTIIYDAQKQITLNLKQ